MGMIRSIYFWVLLLIIGIGLAVTTVIVEDRQLHVQDEIKRRIELKGSNIVGYEEGVPSFDIQADYIWAGRSSYIFEGDGLQAGRLYDSNGKLVAEGMFADRVRVNTKRKILAAFDNIKVTFFQRSDNPKAIHINSDEMRYFSENKRTYLYKNIKLIRDDTLISPKRQVDIDNDLNVAYLNYGFLLNSDEFVASANKMVIYLDDNYSEIMGKVHLVRLSDSAAKDNIDSREEKLRQKITDLKCDYLMYVNQSDNETITVSGNIQLLQEGKYITADYGYYDKDKEFYELKGNIVIKTSSLKWLINKPVESFDNHDIQNSLDVPVVIMGDNLIFDAAAQRLELIGDVKVELPDKVITCQKLSFDDRDEWVQLIGNVVMVKANEDKLMSSFLKLNINDETVVARDHVVTEFKVK